MKNLGPFELRDYQRIAFRRTRAALEDHQRVVLPAPTGSGKTVIGAMLVKRWADLGKRVIFMSPRTVIVGQVRDTFTQCGIQHATIHGVRSLKDESRHKSVWITTPQTLRQRIDKPDWAIRIRTTTDLVVWDECHIDDRKLKSFFTDLKCKIVGLTATPLGRSFWGSFWGAIASANITTDSLITKGYLVPPHPMTMEAHVQTQGVKLRLRDGEYDEGELGARVVEIIGSITKEYDAFVRDRYTQDAPPRTIGFFPTVECARETAAAMEKLGYRFAVITHENTPQEKQITIHRFGRGEYHGIFSCAVLREGFDFAAVDCVIDAHPYRKSTQAVIQQLGRGMRPADGKDRVWWLDFAGNHERLWPTVSRYFTEGYTELPQAPPKKKKKKKRQTEETSDGGGVEVEYIDGEMDDKGLYITGKGNHHTLAQHPRIRNDDDMASYAKRYGLHHMTRQSIHEALVEAYQRWENKRRSYGNDPKPDHTIKWLIRSTYEEITGEKDKLPIDLTVRNVSNNELLVQHIQNIVKIRMRPYRSRY